MWVVFSLSASAADFTAELAAVQGLGNLTNAPTMYADDTTTTPTTVDAGQIKAVYFDGLDYLGEPTRIYAYLGIPAGASASAPVPGVVLLHGGGGTAFRDWVVLWNNRGYAAISIALEGQTDSKLAPTMYTGWHIHNKPGPVKAGTYGDTGVVPISDQWTYHAVADTVLANSLLRSLPVVDKDKIGVMGISWGGVITSTAIGVDSRFAFAIPTYGCGNLDEAVNAWAAPLKDNDMYKEVWDPMVRITNATMPVLWFSWPQDYFFALDCQADCYRAAPGPHMVSLVPGMQHGHEAAWNRPESYAFADSVIAGTPWCVQQSAMGSNGVVTVVFSSTKALSNPILVSTTDLGHTGDRTWSQTAATLVNNGGGIYTITATLPQNVTAWFINGVSGSLVASSDFQEIRSDVILSVTDAAASEEGRDTGSWTVSRIGDTTAPLDVNFVLSGTASNGVDYTLSSTGTVTILAGETDAIITLTPVDDSVADEPLETVTLTLTTADGYAIAYQNSGTVFIQDNDYVAPVVVNQGATALNETSARVSGVTSAGSDVAAWICWGVSDGGTDRMDDWEHVTPVGGVTQGVDFHVTLTGLATNQTYWYRCYVTNVAGACWAPEATRFSGMPVGGGAPWVPTNITMAAWYDAADASTITASSGAVSQWRDKSASARNLNQSTSGARPQTGTRTIGGLNAIEFDGTDDVLTGSANKTDAITIFGVVLTDSGSGADANRSWLSSPGGSNPDYWMKSVAYSDSLGTMMCDTGGAYSSGDATAARSAAHIHAAYSWVAGGANGGTRIDGGASGASIAAKSTTLQKSATELAIGRQKNNAGRFHDGLVGEVIIINQRLTDADADFLKIEGYLAHKWGLAANLPADHQYKNTPPRAADAIINLPPTGISASAATLNASLNATDTNYDVTVYYGTADGGSNAASWGSSAAVGSWENVASANISHAVSGLAAGQTYYYTFMASNTSGEVWASQSWTFKTPVTYSGLDAFNDWAASSGGGITFTGDANGDGLADGMGWLLGADGPTQDANGLLPQSAVTNGDLALTFKMLNPSKRGTAVLRLEHSRDLGVTDPWSENTITIPDANSTVDGVEFTITPIDGTDHNQVTATLPAAAANGTGKLFVRLSGVLVP
jgi:dienelactone hydrolase